MSRVSPEHVANVRVVTAAAVLAEECDLAAYPHRHLAMVAHAGFHGENLAQLLAAADLLAEHGWDLLTVSQLGGGLHAFLRRREGMPGPRTPA
ncbi:transcriptional regulator [Micromonospora sp. NPDC049497]|uniref:transcriptional regulator n=1 Tax=Micromonospora sp. NPDC049497 TaxID=3364273 RepID=UPI0037A3DDEF